MARNLLLVTGGVAPCEALFLAAAGSGHCALGYEKLRLGGLDVMVARQVPDDAHGALVVGLPKVKHLLDDLGRCSAPGILRDRLLPNEPRLAILLKRRLPAVEAGSAYAEALAGPTHMSRLLGMLQYPQPALNLAISLSLRRLPPRPIRL